MTNEQSPPDAEADVFDLKSVVEATFGPGAFDLIADNDPMVPADPTGDGNRSADESAAATEAPSSVEVSPSSRDLKQVVFRLGQHVFAIPVSNVVEIRREPHVTPIPQVPAWVLGVTNLRGSILSVVDMQLRFGLSPGEVAKRRRMIVVRTLSSDTTCGILVDCILDIRQLSESWTQSIDVTPAADFITEWREMDSQPVAVLDLEKAIAINQPI